LAHKEALKAQKAMEAAIGKERKAAEKEALKAQKAAYKEVAKAERALAKEEEKRRKAALANRTKALALLELADALNKQASKLLNGVAEPESEPEPETEPESETETEPGSDVFVRQLHGESYYIHKHKDCFYAYTYDAEETGVSSYVGKALLELDCSALIALIRLIPEPEELAFPLAI
jgi:hypothetical protein